MILPLSQDCDVVDVKGFLFTVYMVISLDLPKEANMNQSTGLMPTNVSSQDVP